MPEELTTLVVPDTLETTVCAAQRSSTRFSWVCDKVPHPADPEAHYFVGVRR